MNMIDNKTASLLGDYLIINSTCSYGTSIVGGKAGLGLTLLELARKLDDERIGNYAFRIVEELMISDSKSLMMLGGSMGVDYTLMYLMDEQLIEVDIDDPFLDRHKAVVEHFTTKIESCQMQDITPLDLFYFAQYKLFRTDCDALLMTLTDIALENVESYCAKSDRNPVMIAMFCNQIEQIFGVIDMSDSQRHVMSRIRASVDQCVTNIDRMDLKTPAGQFVATVMHSDAQTDRDIEALITQTPLIGCNNTFKVMLTLIEWLYAECPSLNLARLRSILGIF